MQARQSMVPLVMSGLLLACGAAPGDEVIRDEAFVASEYFQGIWRQRGYAKMLEVSGERVTVYDVTQVSCVTSGELSSDEVLSLYDRIEGHEDSFGWFEMGAFTRYAFDRVERLPATCAEQPSDTLATFDALYHLFRENYAFFDERNIDWDERFNLGYDLTESSSDFALMDVFRSMLESFGDGHVYVFDPESGDGFLGGSLGQLWEIWAKEYGGNVHSQNPIDPRGVFTADMQRYVLDDVLDKRGKSGPYDMLHWGWLDDDIAYLDVHAMGTLETDLSIIEADAIIEEAMAEIMHELRDANAIVVDIRFNQGGYDTVGYQIASWFTREERVVSQKKAVTDEGWTELSHISIQARDDAFLGPVLLLTSKNSISAAETFALAMRELPNVTLVGTNTYGAFSDAMPRLLPNGWLVSLSNEVYQSPAGEVFEGAGVPPDVSVNYDPQRSVYANLDRTLDKALELAK